MSLDRRWAGWRGSSIDDVATNQPRDRCVFCDLAAALDDDARVIYRGESAFVVLNAYPYTSGHLLVAPLRHEATLTELTSEEASELMTLTRRATSALTTGYTPDGLNVGINLGRAARAGMLGHLHVHVLPRWVGDTSFLTSVAETRLLPEPLSTTLRRVRAAWPDPAPYDGSP